MSTTTRPGAQPGANQRRSAHLEGFATYMSNFVTRHGGPSAVARKVGVSPSQVSSWTNGRSIPYLRTLLVLAESFGLDEKATNRLLKAAGRPPLVGLRKAVAKDPRTTLPALLCGYRDVTCSGDTQASADAIGISRSAFSRLANGSTPLSGLETARRIARALEIPVTAVLKAASQEKGSIATELVEKTSGSAGKIRELIEAMGLDSLDDSVIPEAAARIRVPRGRLEGWLSGKHKVSVLDAQKLSKATGEALSDMLELTGCERRVAEKLAAAIETAPKAERKLTLGEILRSYRVVKGLTQAQVAAALGTERARTVTFYEVNRNVPPAAVLVQLSESLDAPLGRLLRAAELVA